jgi:hypothetical protein
LILLVVNMRIGSQSTETARKRCAMGPNNPVNILLVGLRRQELEVYRHHAGRTERRCYFAESGQELADLPNLREIDIIFDAIKSPGTSIARLVELLSGSRTSAFYSLRVEAGYWWVPVVRFGTNCLGTAAFRPADFAEVFEELVREIRAAVAIPAGSVSEMNLARNFVPVSIGLGKSKMKALAVS